MVIAPMLCQGAFGGLKKCDRMARLHSKIAPINSSHEMGAMPTSELELCNYAAAGRSSGETGTHVGRSHVSYFAYIIDHSSSSLYSSFVHHKIPRQRPENSTITMPLTKQVVLTDKAPKPLSVLNQGLVVGDMARSLPMPSIL